MAVTNSSAANTEYETHGKFVTTQIFPTDDVVHRLSTIFIVYSFLYFRNFLARNEQLFLFLIGTLRNRTRLVFCHQDEKSHLPAATYSTECPVIFLDLFFEDLSKRIQYPFKEPENWKNRPLRHANWRGTSGGKTFCASCCASLIAGSRRAFLCVDCVCLFGVLSEMHEVRTFAPCKAFLFAFFFGA